MQRQLKFRLWYGEGKTWATDNGFAVDMDGNVVCPTSDKTLSKASESFVLSQWTGLHDKNGKEIYEGDVLRMRCGSDDGAFNLAEIPGEVIWHATGFTVRLPDRNFIPSQGTQKGKEVSAKEMHGWVGAHYCLRVWPSKLEVIGNIYENSDLLV